MSRIGAGLALFTLAHGLVNLPYSPGITTDEGWVLQAPYNLLRHGLYGTWDADGPVPFDPHVTTGPVMLLPVWASFALFGEGLLQARVVAVIYSALAVLAFYAVLRSTVDGAVASVSALAFSLTLYPYSRTVIGEIAGLFWLLLGGWLWLRGLESRVSRHYVLAGCCLGAAALAKLVLAPLLSIAVAASWAIAALASRRGSTKPPVGALVLPLLVASLLVLAWLGLQAAVLGREVFGARIADMVGYQPQVLALEANRLAHNALVLLFVLPGALLPWWPVAVLVTPLLLRGQLWNDPRRSCWAVLVACCSLYYVFSLGWPRYGFWAVGLGVIFVAWMAAPLGQALNRWRARAPQWSPVAGAGLVVALLVAPAVGAWHDLGRSDDAAEQVARFLNDQVDARETVGSTEWDIDFVTGWRLRHPPRYILPISQETLESSFDWRWPSVDWVVTGAAGGAFGAEQRLQRDPEWQLRYSAGAYRVFQRARA